MDCRVVRELTYPVHFRPISSHGLEGPQLKATANRNARAHAAMEPSRMWMNRRCRRMGVSCIKKYATDALESDNTTTNSILLA